MMRILNILLDILGMVSNSMLIAYRYHNFNTCCEIFVINVWTSDTFISLPEEIIYSLEKTRTDYDLA